MSARVRPIQPGSMRFLLGCFLLLSLLSLLPAVQPAWAQEGEHGPEIPFGMPLPEGWSSETIPFPLGFAPELEYEGIEELRFAPGMMTADAPDYWSYAFVWWVPAGTDLSHARVAKDLEHYFAGLTRAVVESRGREVDVDALEFDVELIPDEEDEKKFSGHAVTFDAFVKVEPLTLRLEVEIMDCPEAEHRVVMFLISPQPREHAIWAELAGIRKGFQCDGGVEATRHASPD